MVRTKQFFPHIGEQMEWAADTGASGPTDWAADAPAGQNANDGW